MRPRHRTRNSHRVHRSASRYLREHLPLRDFKRSVTIKALWAVLPVTAAEVGSLHATCQWLGGLPAEEAVRQAVYACLPDSAELRRRLNRAPAGRLPEALRCRRRRLAIDLTPIPYHGGPFRDPAEVYRSKAEDGTGHLHAYATAYVAHRGERFTAALPPVPRGAAPADVVQALPRRSRAAGVEPAPLLLDRGVYAADAIRYLHRARPPFPMPVKLTGRKADHPEGPSGTRVFAAMKRSGWFEHAAVSGARAAGVLICGPCRDHRGQWKRHGRQAPVSACWGVAGHSRACAREAYRSRFGIESSYRQMDQMRGRTSTRRPEPRLLYVGSSLVLRDEWVRLHREVLSTPHRGGRLIRQERLRLRALSRRLRQVIESEFGTITEATTEREPCSFLPSD